MVKLGNRIAYLRKQESLSQAELAEQINVSKEALGKYERNEATPTVITAKKIADAFKVSLDHLIDGKTEVVFNKENIKRLKDMELLDEQDKNHLYALMDAFLRDIKVKQAYA